LESVVLNGQSLLCSFTIVNIGICAVPFRDLAFVIEGWSRSEQKPAVYPIETTQARFDFTRLAGGYRGSPVLHERVQIVRMNCLGPAPILHLISRKASVIQPAAVKN